MTIQFSTQELDEIRRYLNSIASGETQNQLTEAYQDSQAWTTLFLLLRKLLAYGIHHIEQTNQEISYTDLQKKTQKPGDMLVHVQTYVDEFSQLLTTYIAHHSNNLSNQIKA
ncbi:hypothetical protein [Spirosoma gilvum]